MFRSSASFSFFVRKRWVDSSGPFGDIAVVSFWCFRFSFMFTILLAVIELKTIWSLVVCCLVDRCLVSQLLFIRLFADMLQFRSIEIVRFINPLSHWIDSLIHRPIGQLIDWSIGCLLEGYGGSFLRCPLLVLLFGALRPWALWPLRVSIGPSWLCRADLSDGKIQKLGTISSRLEVTGEYSIWSACKEHCSRTHVTMWYMIFTFGPNICID